MRTCRKLFSPLPFTVTAMLLLVTIVVYAAPPDPGINHASNAIAKKNVERAKEALTLKMKTCICDMIAANQIWVKWMHASGRVDYDRTTNPPTRQTITIHGANNIDTKVNANDSVKDKYQNADLIVLAGVLLHEKTHWNDHIHTGYDASATNGGDEWQGRREVRAYDAEKIFLCRKVAEYKANKAAMVAQRKAAGVKKPLESYVNHLTFLQDQKDRTLRAWEKYTKKYPPKKKPKSPKDDTKDEKDSAGGQGDPIDDDDGKQKSVGGYKLLTDASSYDLEGVGRGALNGLADGESVWIGLTAESGGTYSDNDMNLLTYDKVFLPTAGEQYLILYRFGVPEYVAPSVRITAFVWPASVSVDWNSPDFGAATRLDIEDLDLIDRRSAQNAGGDALHVNRRGIQEEQSITATFSGPSSVPVVMTSSRWDYDTDDWGSEENLGSFVTNSTGDGSIVVTIPHEDQSRGASGTVRLRASHSSGEVDLVVLVVPLVSNEASYRHVLADIDSNGHEFTIPIRSLEMIAGTPSVDLDLFVSGFGQNGCRMRLYATPENSGSYSDADAIEVTTVQHVIPNDGELGLELPWTLAEGQAYRLSALIWAPDSGQAIWSNRANATRLEIPDVLPRYVPDLDGASEFGILCDKQWTWDDREVTVGVYSTDLALEASVELSYSLGQDGTFSSPVVVGTQALVPESSIDFVVQLPLVAATTVVKWTATISSPTNAFSPFSIETGLGVYDIP